MEGSECVTRRLADELPIGKYTQWAQALSLRGLRVMAAAVASLGEEYRAGLAASDPFLPEVAGPESVDHYRMGKAVRDLASIHAGRTSKQEPQYGGPDFDPSRPGLAEPARERLRSDGPGVSWAADLNERQVWTLLWQVGELGVRLPLSGREPPLPLPCRSAAAEERMRRALRVLVGVHERAGRRR